MHAANSSHSHRSLRAPTSHDWQHVKPFVEELYKVKRHKVKDIVRYLRDEHRLQVAYVKCPTLYFRCDSNPSAGLARLELCHGSHTDIFADSDKRQRSLGRRIKEWGFHKNHKEIELKAVLRKTRQVQRDEGVTPVFELRGKIVSVNELREFWRRKYPPILRLDCLPTPSPSEAPSPVDLFRVDAEKDKISEGDDDEEFQDALATWFTQTVPVQRAVSTPSENLAVVHALSETYHYFVGLDKIEGTFSNSFYKQSSGLHVQCHIDGFELLAAQGQTKLSWLVLDDLFARIRVMYGTSRPITRIISALGIRERLFNAGVKSSNLRKLFNWVLQELRHNARGSPLYAIFSLYVDPKQRSLQHLTHPLLRSLESIVKKRGLQSPKKDAWTITRFKYEAGIIHSIHGDCNLAETLFSDVLNQCTPNEDCNVLDDDTKAWVVFSRCLAYARLKKGDYHSAEKIFQNVHERVEQFAYYSLINTLDWIILLHAQKRYHESIELIAQGLQRAQAIMHDDLSGLCWTTVYEDKWNIAKAALQTKTEEGGPWRTEHGPECGWGPPPTTEEALEDMAPTWGKPMDHTNVETSWEMTELVER